MARRRRGYVPILVGLGVAAAAGVGAFLLLRKTGGTRLTVNGSVDPIGVSATSLLTFDVSGMTPGSSVVVGFSKQPVFDSTTFHAVTLPADSNGKLHATYQQTAGNPVGFVFYIGALDATGKQSNWVTVTVTSL